MESVAKDNYISNLSKRKKLLVVILFWNSLAAILIGFFKFPKQIIYLTDLFNLILFTTVIYTKKFRFSINSTISWMVFFVVFSIGSSIVNFVYPLNVIWGIRQNFRFFVFYYSCIELFDYNIFRIMIKIISIIFWVSLPLCIYESLFVTYPTGTIVGDMVGGIYYGVGSANGPLNIILILYVSYTMIQYFNGEIKFSKLLIILISAMLMSVLAELKIFLVEIVAITLYVLITNKTSIKTVIVVIFLLGIFNTLISSFVLVNARGRSYYTTEMFSVRSMYEYATRSEGYDGVGDLNRFTAIEKLSNIFFDNDFIGLLIGKGLGAAEYSKSSQHFTSDIYREYSYLHYHYFGHSFIFLETGIIGLLSYIMIFVSSLFNGLIKIKNTKIKQYYILCVLTMLFIIFYDTTMRNEYSGYILYSLLSISYSNDM